MRAQQYSQVSAAGHSTDEKSAAPVSPGPATDQEAYQTIKDQYCEGTWEDFQHPSNSVTSSFKLPNSKEG